MKIPFPIQCETCPLYQYHNHKDNGFVPDTIVEGSEVYFVGQNPGADEVAGLQLVKRHWHGSTYTDEKRDVPAQPLIGATGRQFDQVYLSKAGFDRRVVSVGNAIRCRPGSAMGLKADELPSLTSTMKLESSKADIVKALRHCNASHLHVPSSTKLVVTMGRYAMFALTGIQSEEREYGKKQGVVESWRGYGVNVDGFSRFSTVDTSYYHGLGSDLSCSDSHTVFFVMHPAALFKGLNKRFTHATQLDFMKIPRLLRKEWPLPLPEWNTEPPKVWPRYAAFDTEYIPQGNQLIRWSLCDTDSNLYCVESDNTSVHGIPIAPHSTVLIQNALADIAHLSTITDISQVNIEDMMLAHSVLWTGEPHSLNYINSKYGAFNRYKHLSVDNPQLYSALDAYEPMYSWRHHFIPQFKQDQQSWQIYKKYRLPLINIINKAQLTGVKLNGQRLEEVQRILQQRLYEIKEEAIMITGNANFKIGGRTDMLEAIYD